MRFPVVCIVPVVLPLVLLTLPGVFAPPHRALDARAGASIDHLAPPGVYFNDPARTEVTWRLPRRDTTLWSARFAAPEATLVWRPDAPDASRLLVRIDPVTVRTDLAGPGVSGWDERIARDRDFLAGKIITFASTRIEITGERTARVHGQLGLRGEAHPMTLEVTFNGAAEPAASGPGADRAPRLGFSATGRIRRSDWGMTVLLPELGDEVEIAIEAELAPGSV